MFLNMAAKVRKKKHIKLGLWEKTYLLFVIFARLFVSLHSNYSVYRATGIVSDFLIKQQK